MSTTATSTHGTFVWHELMVPDVQAAKRFYGGLFGWKFRDSNIGGANYSEIYMGEKAIGGMMALPEGDQIPPHWMGYVSVPDVDAAAKAAADAGGKVLVSPTDIPDVGRFAVVTDPQGGAISPFKSAHGETAEDAMPGPNTFCWDQLNVSDPNAVMDFYHKVVGWTATTTHGMTTFTNPKDGKQEATVMAAPPGVPGHWVSYVYVEDLAASRKKAAELGGQVLLEELTIEGVGTVSALKDPQGAVFCLYGNPQM